MELAIHTWMRSEPLEHAIRRAAAAGVTALEIAGEPERHVPANVAPMLKAAGMRCFGGVTLMMEGRSLITADANRRAKSVQYVKDCVSLVSDLGGVELSVVPATVGQIVPEGRPEDEWRWAIDSLSECMEHARPRGVTIAIEPINRFETYFINRADQAIALAEAVGPDVGVCLDLFHMNIEEDDVLAALRRAGSRLVDVHVADNNRMPPGMGSLDWRTIVSTLQDMNYDGPLSIEFCAPVDRTPANPHPGSLDENPENVSPEDRKFIEDHGSNLLSESFYTELVNTSAKTLLPLIGR
ncbi:MAG: sugar phosphate isomerase/epimerase [Planctomycetota bacterium]|jgi:sugar phosphate isomerase/epimerase